MPALTQASFLQSLGWAVLNSFWQMALLWVVYNLLLGFGKWTSSGKSKLGFGLLSAGFAWFAWTLQQGFSNPGELASHNILYVFNDATGRGFSNLLPQLLPWLSAVYLILFIVPLFRFFRNYRLLLFLKKKGIEKIDIHWRLFVRRMASYTGIKKPVHIYISSWVQSPVTIGFFKPVILVPAAVLTGLSTAQVEAVLLHELVHIKQHDFLFNFIARLIQTLLYFNPFTHLFIKGIERNREKSCDEMVLRFQYEPQSYAAALLELEKQKSVVPVFALAASGKNYDLLHRIEHILAVKSNYKKRFPVFTIAATVVLLSGLFYSLLFSTNARRYTSPSVKPFGLAQVPDLYFSKTPSTKKLPAVSYSSFTRLNTGASTARNNEVSFSSIPDASTAAYFTNEDYKEASYTEDNRYAADLPETEKGQIKTTLEATRKILEEKEWKALEKELADLVTRSEKQQLKALVNQELANLDWKQMEDKLKSAYDNINWDKLGDKLSLAMNEIRMDSLKQLYTTALAGLSHLDKSDAESEISEQSTVTVAGPTPSASLLSKKALIEECKAVLQNKLDTIKSIRARKIVRL
jgi:bla regulator protein blaR1